MKNLLEARGVEVFLKNEFQQGAAGQLSAFDVWPELWIVNEEQYDQAKGLIEEAISKSVSEDWVCNVCNETNDGSFDLCWRCQHEK